MTNPSISVIEPVSSPPIFSVFQDLKLLDMMGADSSQSLFLSLFLRQDLRRKVEVKNQLQLKCPTIIELSLLKLECEV